MEIYSIKIDGKFFKNYKTREDALNDFTSQINLNKNSNIRMYLEDFGDYGHLDNCCKIYMLSEYKDNIIYNNLTNI